MSQRNNCSDRCQKTATLKAGFHDQVSSIYLPPLSLYYWVAIMFSCWAETFCRCASYLSGLLVEEPVLRLILVHLGPESLEGRKPERDYEAQDIVVVTDFSYFSLFCVLLQRRKEKSNISSLLGNPKVNSVTLGAFLLNLNSPLSLSHIFS